MLNAGVSVAAGYAISTSIADDGAERILLCTSQGFKWVLVSDLGIDSETKKTSSFTSHDCPFCTFSIYTIDDALQNSSLSLGLNPCYKKSHHINSVKSTLFNPELLSDSPSRAPPTFL